MFGLLYKKNKKRGLVLAFCFSLFHRANALKTGNDCNSHTASIKIIKSNPSTNLEICSPNCFGFFEAKTKAIKVTITIIMSVTSAQKHGDGIVIIGLSLIFSHINIYEGLITVKFAIDSFSSYN